MLIQQNTNQLLSDQISHGVSINYADNPHDKKSVSIVAHEMECLVAAEKVVALQELMICTFKDWNSFLEVWDAARRSRLNRLIHILIHANLEELFDIPGFDRARWADTKKTYFAYNNNKKIEDICFHDEKKYYGKLNIDRTCTLDHIIWLIDAGEEQRAFSVLGHVDLEIIDDILFDFLQKILKRHKGPSAPRMQKKEWFDLVYFLYEK